jgi:hypothetical protein
LSLKKKSDSGNFCPKLAAEMAIAPMIIPVIPSNLIIVLGCGNKNQIVQTGL